MSNKMKIWLIVATSLSVVGCIIFAGVMTVLKWDFLKLDTSKFETNTHEIAEEFDNISIKTDTADIDFVLTENGECKVVCFERSKVKHSVTVEDGVLTVSVVDERKWYDYIKVFSFKTPKITVYLPKAQYGALDIKNSTGDIEIPKDFGFQSVGVSSSTGNVNVFASTTDALKINLSTGNIRVENLSAGKLQIAVSTGDVLLKNVIVNGTLSLKTSTGDIKLALCDAEELFMETDTGDVEGSLLSEKVFITKTDTGDVDVPKTVTGGRCEITTDTGDIEITVK